MKCIMKLHPSINQVVPVGKIEDIALKKALFWWSAVFNLAIIPELDILSHVKAAAVGSSSSADILVL